MNIEIKRLLKKFLVLYGGATQYINRRLFWIGGADQKPYHVNTVFLRRGLLEANLRTRNELKSLLEINKKEEIHEEPKQEIVVNGRTEPEQRGVEAEEPKLTEVVTQGTRVEEVKKKTKSRKKETVVKVATEAEQGKETLKEE